MNEEEKQAIEILRSFEPNDLFEFDIYLQALEKLTNLIDKQQKEIEELKQDRNNNNKLIELSKNEILGYLQGYEDGKKLNRNAVVCVVENQQYYIIKKEIELYKEQIEKLQNDNKYYKGIINKLYGEIRK